MRFSLHFVVTLAPVWFVVVRGASILRKDPAEQSIAQVGKFLSQLLSDHSSGSVGGVCFFGAPLGGAGKALQNALLPQNVSANRAHRWTGDGVVRLCETTRLCTGIGRNRASAKPWRCEVSLIFVQIPLQKVMQELSRVSFWGPSAVHVFLYERSGARPSDGSLAETLLTFGVTRTLFVQLPQRPQPGLGFEVYFPILFARRVIRVVPGEASARWLRGFDQLSDLHGYQYRTLYHTLIPYLYRYDGVFGGPDYRFLQTALEWQNATHLWIYHRTTDDRINSTDLQYVDRKLLEQGRVAFSLNRLMVPSPDRQLEQLYLNTFDGKCVLVPRKQLQIFILRLWEPFSQYLWYMVLAIALLTIAGNLTLPSLFVVNYLLALLFGSAIPNYRMAALDRAILLVLDVLLFLLREAYTAKIITYMIRQRYEPELHTMAELGRVGPPLLLTPGDYGALADILSSIVPPPRVVLRDDYSSFHTTWEEYFRRGFAHVVPCSYGQALVVSYGMNAPDAPKFYLLRERLAIAPEAFTFRRLSPFLGKLRVLVASLHESGIVGSWLQSDIYAEDHTSTLEEILRFENLASLFYVLLIGYVASFAVFVVERIISYANRKRLQRWADRMVRAKGKWKHIFSPRCFRMKKKEKKEAKQKMAKRTKKATPVNQRKLSILSVQSLISQ